MKSILDIFSDKQVDLLLLDASSQSELIKEAANRGEAFCSGGNYSTRYFYSHYRPSHDYYKEELLDMVDCLNSNFNLKTNVSLKNFNTILRVKKSEYNYDSFSIELLLANVDSAFLKSKGKGYCLTLAKGSQRVEIKLLIGSYHYTGDNWQESLMSLTNDMKKIANTSH